MLTTILHSFWTVLAFITFVGIVLWAWSSKRKHDFEKLSHLPLEDDRPTGKQG